MSSFNRDQVIELLEYMGATKIKSVEGKDNIMCTCPFHREENPSFGFSMSKQVGNCFSCHINGDMGWLLVKCLPDDFKNLRQADEFLKTNYNVDLNYLSENAAQRKIITYDDLYEEESRIKKPIILPRYKLAPYKSGKSTYEYFFDRGFTKKTVREYEIGRDLINETVTLPVYNENSELVGFLGRYIDPDRAHNERYKIYDFKTGQTLYPVHKLSVQKDTIIIVEGVLDALWLHQLGYRNALATMTNNISQWQSEFVFNNCSTLIDFTDNDKRGEEFSDRLFKRFYRKLNLKTVKHLYPTGCNDPQQCHPEDIEYMLNNAKVVRKELVREYE